MNPGIESIGAIGESAQSASTQAVQGSSESSIGRFGTWFTQELGNVNAQMVKAEQGVQQLATGGSANLHDTMLTLEQARLAFQLAVNVRNRVLEAYQEIMRMQV